MVSLKYSVSLILKQFPGVDFYSRVERLNMFNQRESRSMKTPTKHPQSGGTDNVGL